jgi:hypothetical protein
MSATYELHVLVEMFAGCEGLRKSDLRPGDWIVVKTRNSVYSIYVLGNGQYVVSGGWFDRQGLAPATTTINGCTWGGRVIQTGLVAARGLFLEFGNDIMTTRIQDVRLIRGDEWRQSVN